MPSRLTDFLAELKRRRVYTVGVTYVVVGLGVLGAAEVTPEGVVRDRGVSGVGAEAAPPSDGSPSIAVLPFVDMSPDRDQEYFGDGLAEELINALTRLEGLRVAARTSTFTLAKREADVATIAGSPGVRHVLEGSVRKSGNRLRVTPGALFAGISSVVPGVRPGGRGACEPKGPRARPRVCGGIGLARGGPVVPGVGG